MQLINLLAAFTAVSRQSDSPTPTLSGDDKMMIEAFIAAGPLASGEERDVLYRDGGIMDTVPPADLVAIRDWLVPQVVGMFDLVIRRGECFGPIPPWYLIARRVGGVS